MDRIARIVIAMLALVAAYVVEQAGLRIALVVLGIFSAYEAVAGWCALYALLGRNTCPIE